MTVAEWKAEYDAEVRPLMPWLPEADFEITPNGENRAYYRDLIAGRSKFYVPDHAPELDLLKHEAGHAAHAAAAAERDLIEGLGTAGTDIYREVAAIVSPGVIWPSSGPDLRDEWTAEAFRKAIGGDLAIVRYPDPPGVVSPYPVAALLAYFATMNVPRLTVQPVTVDYTGAIWLPSPNFTPGGNAATHIVDHWTVAPLASTLATLTTPGGNSAHYVVDHSEAPVKIYQLVRERDRAWHDSSFGWNDKAIGIEHVHFDEDAGVPGIQQPWPSDQLEASAALHRSIAARHGIPLDFDHVKGHGNTYPVFTTECPGDLPIGRLIEDVLNMAEITETRLREIIRDESTVPIVNAVNALSKIVLNHKLRRTARWIVAKLTNNAALLRDPGGVGGTDTVGYTDDNTPLA